MLLMLFIGVTPQRRDFRYPTKLTQTRAHTELLEEFRRDREITLPELPESDSENDITVSTGFATVHQPNCLYARQIPSL